MSLAPVSSLALSTSSSSFIEHPNPSPCEPLTEDAYYTVYDRWSKTVKNGWPEFTKQNYYDHLGIAWSLVEEWRELNEQHLVRPRSIVLQLIRTEFANCYVLEEHFCGNNWKKHRQLCLQGKAAESKARAKKGNDDRKNEETKRQSFLHYLSWMQNKFPSFTPGVFSTQLSPLMITGPKSVARLSIIDHPLRITNKDTATPLLFIEFQTVHHFSQQRLHVLAQVILSGLKPRNPMVIDNELYDADTNERVKFMHVIIEVSPRYQPFDSIMGEMFSSFNTSARLFGGRDGWKEWSVLNHPKLTMKSIVDGKSDNYFSNHAMLMHPISYPGTTIHTVTPMQLTIMSSMFDCNDIHCRTGDTGKCDHGYARHSHSSNDLLSFEGQRTGRDEQMSDDQHERDLRAKRGAVEYEPVINADVEFTFDLHDRLHTLRVLQGPDVADYFIRGSNNKIHFQRHDYVMTTDDVDQLLRNYELNVIHGISANTFIAGVLDENQQTQRQHFFLLSSFRLKSSKTWEQYNIRRRSEEPHLLYVPLRYDLLLRCIRNSHISTTDADTMIQSTNALLTRFDNKATFLSVSRAIVQVEENLRQFISAEPSISESLSDDLERTLDLIGEYQVLGGVNDPRVILKQKKQFIENRYLELYYRIQFLLCGLDRIYSTVTIEKDTHFQCARK